MSQMKKTPGGTIAAFTYNAQQDGDVEYGAGISVGQYASETVLVEKGLTDLSTRAYGFVSVENDPDTDTLRVVVQEENCRKFGVPAYVFTELEDGTGAYIPINTQQTKVFVLVENVENDMVANRYPSLFDAQQAMFRRYAEIITGRQFKATKYAKMSFPACLPDLEDDPDMDDDETRGIHEKDACIWDGPNHDNYSWRIFEL